ncbi:alpha-galactosidase [Streptomyces sp. SYSU K217416]
MSPNTTAPASARRGVPRALALRGLRRRTRPCSAPLPRLSAQPTAPRLAAATDHPQHLGAGVRTRGGAPGEHAQTVAVYRMLQEIKAAHPDLEIESRAAGGGRIDLDILEVTDRVWASDVSDPLERQRLMRWTGQLLPTELLGSHIASPHSHTTSRRHDLSFRGATALFGHLGVEWDGVAGAGPGRRHLDPRGRRQGPVRGPLRDRFPHLVCDGRSASCPPCGSRFAAPLPDAATPRRCAAGRLLPSHVVGRGRLRSARIRPDARRTAGAGHTPRALGRHPHAGRRSRYLAGHGECEGQRCSAPPRSRS